MSTRRNLPRGSSRANFGKGGASDDQLIFTPEANSRLWWDTRNGQGSITNCDNALYGWRTDGSGCFYGDGGIVYDQGYPAKRYPTAWVAKLLTRFAAGRSHPEANW